ncbi:hypothetical protein ACC786_38090, partial [Rhizobium ruizarguesonis]
ALPALKDRLPENPLFVKPVERVGKYGGSWNMALVGGGSLSMLFRYQAYEPLLRYTPDWSGVTIYWSIRSTSPCMAFSSRT